MCQGFYFQIGGVLLTTYPDKLCLFIKSLFLCLGAEVEMLVHRKPVLPQGARTLSTKQAQLDIRMETAAGDPSDYTIGSHTCKQHIQTSFMKTSGSQM